MSSLMIIWWLLLDGANVPANFGDRLVTARSLLGLDRERLARLAQVSIEVLQELERNERVPSPEDLQRLAQVLARALDERKRRPARGGGVGRLTPPFVPAPGSRLTDLVPYLLELPRQQQRQLVRLMDERIRALRAAAPAPRSEGP